MQVLALLNLPLLYPASLRQYLNFYSQVTSAAAVVSLDCSLPDEGDVSKATIRTLIDALAPLYMSAACCLGWLLWSIFVFFKAR